MLLYVFASSKREIVDKTMENVRQQKAFLPPWRWLSRDDLRGHGRGWLEEKTVGFNGSKGGLQDREPSRRTQESSSE